MVSYNSRQHNTPPCTEEFFMDNYNNMTTAEIKDRIKNFPQSWNLADAENGMRLTKSIVS